MSIRRRVVPMVLVASLAAGCSSAGPSSGSEGPIGTDAVRSASPYVLTSSPPAVSPTRTPIPTMPVLATEARSATDGVEIHLELERNPLPAGERTWATVTIRNRSDAMVPWMTNGCVQPAQLLGVLGGDWVGGAMQTGIARRFKEFALEPLGHSGQAYLLIGFVGEERIGRDSGCADLALMHELAPGEKIVHRAAWDGALDDLVPPDGPIGLIASFPRQVGSRTVPVEVRLDSWIVGGTPFEFLTPAAAIDAALGDARFREWLERTHESRWINSTHTLKPEAGTWDIGLFAETADGILGMVTLDARTGEILGHRFE